MRFYALYAALLVAPLAHGYLLPSIPLPRAYSLAAAHCRAQAPHDESVRTGFVAYPWPATEDEARRARFPLPSAPVVQSYRVTLFDPSDSEDRRCPTDNGLEVVLVESILGPSERRGDDEAVRQEVALMLELMHNIMLEARGQGRTIAMVVDFTSHLRLPRPQLWPAIAMKLRVFGDCLLKGFEHGVPVAEATVVLPRLDIVSRRVFIPPAQQLAARLGVKLCILDQAQGGDAALAAKKRALGI